MRATAVLLLLLGLGACGARAPLLPFGVVENNGPDPAAVRPVRPLEIPSRLTLPPPGGTSRAEY